MTYRPEQDPPPVIVCRDETSDFLPFADAHRFRTDPVSLTDLRRALADMRARFTNHSVPEDS
ncbi:hypothetical protein [Streptomyces sp. NPDC001286]